MHFLLVYVLIAVCFNTIMAKLMFDPVVILEAKDFINCSMFGWYLKTVGDLSNKHSEAAHCCNAH